MSTTYTIARDLTLEDGREIDDAEVTYIVEGPEAPAIRIERISAYMNGTSEFSAWQFTRRAWQNLLNDCAEDYESRHSDPAPEPPVCDRCDDSILPGQPVELLHDEPVHRQCYENHVERMAELDYAQRMNGEGSSPSRHYHAAMQDAGRAHWV